jgi:CHAD domain-containing protein
MEPFMAKTTHIARDGATTSAASPALPGRAGFQDARQDGRPPARQAVTPGFDELNAPEVSRRVLRLALKQLDRLIALEPKVLRGESTAAVHNLRVASRRLQGLVDYLCPGPTRNGMRKLRRRLKKARRALGDLRNQDVLAWRIERALARKRVARRAAWLAARDYVGDLRPKTAERAHRKLTKLNLPDFYVRMRKELEGCWPDEAGGLPRVIAFPEERTAPEGTAAIESGLGGMASNAVESAGRFSARLAELWQDFSAKGAAALEDAGGLHPLRIAAKRLRYLVEVAADLEITGSGEALVWLRGLQGRLGDWHDDQVLGGAMLEMVAGRDFLERHLRLAIEVEKLVLALRSSRTRACERYLDRTFKSPEYRRTEQWVGQWVGQWAASRPVPRA